MNCKKCKSNIEEKYVSFCSLPIGWNCNCTRISWVGTFPRYWREDKMEKAFENIWKVKSLSKKFKQKDKERYYELFLDGYGCAMIDIESQKMLELNLSMKEALEKIRIIDERTKDMKDKIEKINNNHSQQGLEKEVGSDRILASNKKSVYADNPTDNHNQQLPGTNIRSGEQGIKYKNSFADNDKGETK